MIRYIFLVGLLFLITLSSAWGQEPALKRVDIDFELTDGAAWDGHRTLFVPDVKGGVLWSIPTEQDIRKARKRLDGDWAISGTYYQNGTLYFVDGAKRKLFQLPESGAPKELVAFGEEQRPNDLVVDLRGDIYITFTREGVVRRVAADGEVSVVITDLVQPNGISLSPDDKTIYVSSISTGQLVAAKIDLSKGQFETSSFAQLPKTEIGFRGDGMTVDRAGNVYCTGGRSVCVFDPDGEMIDEIVTKARPINVVFGGDIQRHLYISTFDGLYVMPRNAYGRCPMPAVDMTGIESTTQISYANIDGRNLYMDVYRPESATGQLPAVIVIHGGGWVKGAKEKFAALSAAICRRGYIVANIEYRLGHEAKFPAAIRDCNAAAAYLRTHAADFGIDPNRIAAVGGSAGGHLAGLVAAGHDIAELRHAGTEESSHLDALVVMAGPMEISPGRFADQSISEPEKSFAVVWFGGDAKQKPDLYKLADVTSKVDATMPPVLFLTGSKDKPDKNKAVQEKLESLGVETALSIVQGAKHAQWNSPQFMPLFVEAIDRFLRKNLPSTDDPIAPRSKVDLFHGQDLTGWELTLETPETGVFNASEGVIQVAGMPFGYLRTEKAYKDYRLHVEWRYLDTPPAPGKNRNSGVLLHMTGEDKVWPNFTEAQLRANNAGFFVFSGDSTCTEIEKATEQRKARGNNKKVRVIKRKPNVEEKPVGQWNSYDIVCMGDTVTLTVNGKLANKATGCVPAAGKIGL
ncbi:MAG: SMP-30/gluconolactonase/LRE family protein [Lacipirellulaceae bacterium]